MTDSAPMAIIEWVDLPAAEADEVVEAPAAEEAKPAKKVAKKKAAEKTEEPAAAAE
jgi:hypothetical protein